MLARMPVLLALLPVLALAQAGTIQFGEGEIFVGDSPVAVDAENPPVLETGEHLRTEKGNAEMIFAMGSFIRLGADSEVEMVDAGITSATVRLHRGAMIVDVFNAWGGDSLKVLVADAAATISDAGVYRLAADADRGSLRVLSGGAVLSVSGNDHRIKKRQMAEFGGPAVQTVKAKALPNDALTAWHTSRSEMVGGSRAKRGKRGDNGGDGDKPFGLGDLPDRVSSGIN